MALTFSIGAIGAVTALAAVHLRRPRKPPVGAAGTPGGGTGVMSAMLSKMPSGAFALTWSMRWTLALWPARGAG